MSLNCDAVRLNVGGVLYTTTRSTLLRYPNSMLGAMFNGSMSTSVDENGYYFIDRDGQIFRYILNFLRSSQLSLPADFENLDLLAVEADFYQLEPLINCVNKMLAKRDIPNNGHYLEVIEVRSGPTATMPTNNSRDKTVISGRRDVIGSLPTNFFIPVEKVQSMPTSSEQDFIELELVGSNVRLRLGEHLKQNGWTLVDSDLSSSSCYDTRSMSGMGGTLIIEHSFRDRWFLQSQSFC